jgi:hypothetical protein
MTLASPLVEITRPEEWHMWQHVMIGLPVGLLLLVGCASMTPEARLANEIYWDAAKACEARYHTLHLDTIDQDGSVTIHADADSRSEYRPFVACYQEEVRARIEKMRQAGLPVPEALNRERTVELD